MSRRSRTLSAGAVAALAVSCLGAGGAAAAPSPDRLAWGTAATPPLSPREEPGLVRIGEHTVIAFAGLHRPAPNATMVALHDAAIYDEDTDTWHKAAPLPDDLQVNAGTIDGSVGGDGYAWVRTRRAVPDAAPQPLILRYSAAQDTWTVLPVSPVPGNAMYAAGPRLLMLNLSPDDPGHGPAGAVLDAGGVWNPLPADPFVGHPAENPAWLPWTRKHPRIKPGQHLKPPPRTAWTRTAVWAGDQLLLTEQAAAGRTMDVAALSLDGTEANTWRRLAAVPVPEGTGPAAPGTPAWVAGRVVWPYVVYDPATGTSRPTPAAIRSEPTDRPDDGTDSPFLHVLGDRVTVAGYLLDPVHDTAIRLPTRPDDLFTQNSATIGGPHGELVLAGLAAGNPPYETNRLAIMRLTEPAATGGVGRS